MSPPIPADPRAVPSVQPEDIARIRKLAQEATPGPWHACPHLRKDCDCTCGYSGDIHVDGMYVCFFGRSHADHVDDDGCGCHMLPIGTLEQRQANGSYIAAADPSTVLALLDRLEKLERVAETYGALRDGEYKNQCALDAGFGEVISTAHLQRIADEALRALSAPVPEKSDA